ncbi:hypothetical protein Pfo_010981 [Paulownia fortunei]|nr:hypothetical protein Pfo_010981 [Paulownia fortunei]
MGEADGGGATVVVETRMGEADGGSGSTLFAATDPQLVELCESLKAKDWPVCAFINYDRRPGNPSIEAHNVETSCRLIVIGLSHRMDAKADKTGGGEVAAVAVVVVSNPHRSRGFFNKTSWLLCTIADANHATLYLGDRVKMLTRKIPKENIADSFAAMVNFLLTMSTLSCCHYCKSCVMDTSLWWTAIARHLPSLPHNFLIIPASNCTFCTIQEMDADIIISRMVIKSVEYDISLNELTVLQKNLLDVLKSEMLLLLNDRCNAEVQSDSIGRWLARCVLKTGEDHRGQIYRLERRNKVSYEQLVKQEEEKNKGKGGEHVVVEDCFEVHCVGAAGLSKCFSINVKRVSDQNAYGGEGGKVSKLLDTIKKFNMLLRGPHFNCASSTAKHTCPTI